MKNDFLLKAFAQDGLQAKLVKSNSLQSLALSPLDSGQLIKVKGGSDSNGRDKVVLSN